MVMGCGTIIMHITFLFSTKVDLSPVVFFPACTDQLNDSSLFKMGWCMMMTSRSGTDPKKAWEKKIKERLSSVGCVEYGSSHVITTR